MEVLLLGKGMDGSQSTLLYTSLHPLAGPLHIFDGTHGCLRMRQNLIARKSDPSPSLCRPVTACLQSRCRACLQAGQQAEQQCLILMPQRIRDGQQMPPAPPSSKLWAPVQGGVLHAMRRCRHKSQPAGCHGDAPPANAALHRAYTHPVAAGVLQHGDQPSRSRRCDEIPCDLAAVRCQLACKTHLEEALSTTSALVSHGMGQLVTPQTRSEAPRHLWQR